MTGSHVVAFDALAAVTATHMWHTQSTTACCCSVSVARQVVCVCGGGWVATKQCICVFLSRVPLPPWLLGLCGTRASLYCVYHIYIMRLVMLFVTRWEGMAPKCFVTTTSSHSSTRSYSRVNSSTPLIKRCSAVGGWVCWSSLCWWLVPHLRHTSLDSNPHVHM